jgi:hypothetical protein
MGPAIPRARKTYVTGSRAYRIMIEKGYSKSYPTALKWLEHNGLSTQPAGPKGGIIVEEELLKNHIQTLKSKGVWPDGA